jgi:hypothetical protein
MTGSEGAGGKANPKGAGPRTAWTPSSVAGSLSPPVASREGATTKTTLTTTDGAAAIFAAAATFTAGDQIGRDSRRWCCEPSSRKGWGRTTPLRPWATCPGSATTPTKAGCRAW